MEDSSPEYVYNGCMKSDLVFLTAETLEPASCGESLEISLSSREMGWEGILLEKGFSPSFYPKDIVTPYFYFAVGQERDLRWRIKSEASVTELVTHPDEIWFNPPFTAFTHDIDEPCYFVILGIDKDRMFDALGAQVERDAVELLNNYSIVDPLLKNMIDMFYLEVRGGGKNGSGFIDRILRVLADYFFRNYSNLSDLESRDPGGKSRLSREDLKKIDDFYEAHIGESFSLDAPASLVNMSLFHFLREFKKSRGITPHQYLIKMKIAKAKSMLEEGRLSLQHIAYDLGFSDQSHFSRTFKKFAGVSPRNYRT